VNFRWQVDKEAVVILIKNPAHIIVSMLYVYIPPFRDVNYATPRHA